MTYDQFKTEVLTIEKEIEEQISKAQIWANYKELNSLDKCLNNPEIKQIIRHLQFLDNHKSNLILTERRNYYYMVKEVIEARNASMSQALEDALKEFNP